MDVQLVRSFLLWCTAMNYAILVVWFLVFVAARDRLRAIHTSWFRLGDEQFDALHYAGMAAYKIGILTFNLVPLVALSVVR
ncbi:MAG TPA: hypothetical protein VFD92_17625 [Candidatus Binatia bacterium]|nr:hypothetical protein [Candidatus Binatia bacterium]